MRKCLKYLKNILKIPIWNIKKKKIYKVIYSTYLCIKFPFLYPRNRFTGKHECYFNWLLKFTNKYYEKAYTDFSLQYKFYKDPSECVETNNVVEICNFKISLINNNTQLKFEKKSIDTPIIFNLYNYNIKEFSITGITTYQFWRPTIVCHFHKNEVVNLTYGFPHETITICTNKIAEKMYKSILWVEKNIINKICFIPSYTELDSMPNGWRNAFGAQLCEELKQVLKKHKYLYKYRITQIKEKFGELRWYSNGSPEGCEYPIIDKYEKLSRKTCIICGKPATYVSIGWICPYCNDHIGDITKAIPINIYYK